MKNKKTISSIAVFLIQSFIIGFVFVLPLGAFADSLTVEFETDPLFSESNFLPGSSVSRWARVVNGSDFSQDILAEAINITDRDKFGDVLNMTITKEGSELFNDTLSIFFNSGEIFLSTLGAGEETEYNFKVSFKNDSGNDYEESALGFDILIGFRGEGSPLPPSGGGGGSGSGSSGSGGSGYVIPPRGLVILDESTVVNSISTTTVSISWATSHKSTSRVVYDTVSGVFDFNNPPNYGYSLSTIELDTPPETNGVTYHTVLLTGLTPSTTYYYRVISHASPPSIGVEKKFATLGPGAPEEVVDKKEDIFDGMGGEGSLEQTGDFVAESDSLVSDERRHKASSANSTNENNDRISIEDEDNKIGTIKEERELELVESEGLSKVLDSEKDSFLNSTASLFRDIFGKRWLSIGFLIIAIVCGALAVRRILGKIRLHD